MDEKPDPDRPIDTPRPTGGAGGDPVLNWAGQALEDVHKAAGGESAGPRPNSPSLEEIEREIQDMNPRDARLTVESYQNREQDPAMYVNLGHMVDALKHREREREARERSWRSRFTVSRIAAAGIAGVVLAFIILFSVLAGTGELSCAPDEQASNAPTASSEPAPLAEQPGAQTGSGSPGSGDPYLEARAALGLSTTTPASAEHMNAGAGPMQYELSWVDGAESPRVELGSIGVITLIEDRAMQEGGRATVEGNDSVGAYVIGKAAGQLNIGVRIALRVPGPDGGEPQLLVFSLENTEGSSLLGTAKPYGSGDPDPPWYVLGERIQSK